MQKIALIVAGGKGKRINSKVPKQFLKLNGLPIIMHTLKVFNYFDKLVLVLPENEIKNWEALCFEHNFEQKIILAKGGKNRLESVRNGLDKISEEAIVAIHDAVRPFVSKKLISKLLKQVKINTGAVPVIPAKDSLRQIENNYSFNLDRAKIFNVQTPQCFISKEIKIAYSKIDNNSSFTDDASVFEHSKGEINTVLGEEDNFKITTDRDLLIASLY